jgi:hypothetical protein
VLVELLDVDVELVVGRVDVDVDVLLVELLVDVVVGCTVVDVLDVVTGAVVVVAQPGVSADTQRVLVDSLPALSVAEIE